MERKLITRKIWLALLLLSGGVLLLSAEHGPLILAMGNGLQFFAGIGFQEKERWTFNL